MDPDTYEKGREIRTAVLGEAYVAARGRPTPTNSPSRCKIWSPSTAGARCGDEKG